MKIDTAIALLLTTVIVSDTALISNSMLHEQEIINANYKTVDLSEGISYDEAIEDLYSRSTSISDQEIIEIASNMKPDSSAVTNEVGEAQADKIMDTLTAYEEQKVSYLMGSDAAGAEETLVAEWDRQKEYTQMGISGAQTLTRLIPGFTVTSCEEKGGCVVVNVDEWMTEGYTEGEQDVENVSAYRYYYTAVLDNNGEGNWEVCSVTNTDRNFAWLEDASVQQEQFGAGTEGQTAAQTASQTVVQTASRTVAQTASQTAAQTASLAADQEASLTEDQTAALTEDQMKVRMRGHMEEIAKRTVTALEETMQGLVAFKRDDEEEREIRTATLKTYGDGTYTYNVDNAIAYADKWATSRNPAYKQYPGVDCCNFVSQCLYAGGMPKNSSWYPASYAWINCTGAIKNFKNYGTFMSANNGNVLRGNPVYYDWNSNGVYDHTAICVGTNSSGTPIIDAHTGDHYHATWTLGSNGKRATIQLRGNGSVSGSSTTTVTDGKWESKNGSWYYYSADGSMLKGWINYKNNYYYLSSDGSMETGWAKIGSSWYYFNASGVMKTGWLRYGSKWYFLSDQGAMKTGWLKDGGNWYYLADDGHAVTGWKEIKGETYYFNSNCTMKTGLAEIDGLKYYFDSQGHKTLRWVTIGGKKYFFSPSEGGRAATGSWKINGKTYTFNSEGVLIG